MAGGEEINSIHLPFSHLLVLHRLQNVYSLSSFLCLILFLSFRPRLTLFKQCATNVLYVLVNQQQIMIQRQIITQAEKMKITKTISDQWLKTDSRTKMKTGKVDTIKMIHGKTYHKDNLPSLIVNLSFNINVRRLFQFCTLIDWQLVAAPLFAANSQYWSRKIAFIHFLQHQGQTNYYGCQVCPIVSSDWTSVSILLSHYRRS